MSNQTDTSTLPSLWGRLTVTKVFSPFHSETLFVEDNLIVRQAKLIVLGQLYYGSGSGDPLSYAKVGTGGAEDPSGLFLKTPTPSMTNLYSPQISVAMSRTSFNTSTPSITLVATIDNSQGNGLKLNEAGFFTASGMMLNIKTFPFVAKDNGFSLNLTWEIGA